MLDDRLDQYMKDAEEESVGVQSVEADIKEIQAMMRVDGEFFIEFFLADQLDMPVPEFHKEIWERLTDKEKTQVLLAVPRDHAKTTLAKLSVIWHWLHTNHRFIVYLSNTNPIAKGACKDIIDYLSHPNFVQVYGKVDMVKSSENESLWVFDIMMPSGVKKRCILRAVGQGQQMRGINLDNRRPDFAVIDDVEDKDNTHSEYQQKQLDDWMFATFIKALAKKRKILWLGNMLQKTSLLARLSRNSRWNPVVFGSLVKNNITGVLQPLWPDKWSVKELMEDFQNFKDLALVESWMCEMMNMPGHGKNGFTADQINYAPVPLPDDVQACWITVDPAFGLKAHNDESAIAIHYLPHSGPPGTAEIRHGKWDETRLFEEIYAAAVYWDAWTWGIEAVAAQRVLIPFFQLLLQTRGSNRTVEMIPLMSGRGDPKIGRIKAFVSLMASGEWTVAEDDIDLTTQMLELDMSKTDQADDIIDAAAYGPVMADSYRGLIIAQAQGLDIMSAVARYGTEIENV